MEPLRINRVRRLVTAGTATLALTAYLPASSDASPLAEALQKVREKAEKALAKHPDRREAENVRTNLEYALNRLMESPSLGEGTWLVAVTTQESEAIFLPFQWKEEITIGKTLKVHPALYALYRTRTVFVCLASENSARWFEGVGDRVFPLPLAESVREALAHLQKARHYFQSGPTEGGRFEEMFSEMARAAYNVALVKYIETLRAAVAHYLELEKVPVLLMGDERLIEEVSRGLEGRGPVSRIGGIPETASPEIIQHHLVQHLHHQARVLEQMYYPFLQYSEAQTPQEIWQLLQDSLPSSPVLFVEEGYSLPVQELLGRKQQASTSDGLDLLIASVREKGGEVLFLPPGKLPSPLMLLLP
ncbi:MAG: hypothetical protein RMJ49_02500 [Bacteroidia bacterium]|nr:hypothetical protein [Bacteroidia bacterium]